jgi:hypothetical protein
MKIPSTYRSQNISSHIIVVSYLSRTSRLASLWSHIYQGHLVSHHCGSNVSVYLVSHHCGLICIKDISSRVIVVSYLPRTFRLTSLWSHMYQEHLVSRHCGLIFTKDISSHIIVVSYVSRTSRLTSLWSHMYQGHLVSTHIISDLPRNSTYPMKITMHITCT